MVMGLVRSHRRWGAWAGLAALALQIMLSFGHVHRDDLGVPLSAAADHVQIASGASSAPDRSIQHEHNSGTDDHCPICVTMASIATALPSVPPTLIVPVSVRYAWSSHAAVRGVSAQFTPSFQARGPPFA